MHKTEINYEGGLDQLAIDISNLRYDSLEYFLNKLSIKINKDSIADAERGRKQLADSLHWASCLLELARSPINEAWKVSKPYMKDVK